MAGCSALPFLTYGYAKHRNELLGRWICITPAILRMLISSADQMQRRKDSYSE